MPKKESLGAEYIKTTKKDLQETEKRIKALKKKIANYRISGEKSGGNRKAEIKKSLSRVQKIMKKVKAKGRKRKEIEAALSSVLRSPHISGIRRGIPRVEYDASPSGYSIYGRGNYVFKISISTTKTRKTFGIRSF